jgi:hypothetical protein
MHMDITADEAAKIAASHLWDGYNYAESVLMAMQELWHMEKRPDIATAFGAGIGRLGLLRRNRRDNCNHGLSPNL